MEILGWSELHANFSLFVIYHLIKLQLLITISSFKHTSHYCLNDLLYSFSPTGKKEVIAVLLWHVSFQFLLPINVLQFFRWQSEKLSIKAAFTVVSLRAKEYICSLTFWSTSFQPLIYSSY